MGNLPERSRMAIALSVGTVITSNVVGGVVVGYLLDRWFGTAPWMITIGLILGTVSAFVSLYRILSKLN